MSLPQNKSLLNKSSQNKSAQQQTPPRKGRPKKHATRSRIMDEMLPFRPAVLKRSKQDWYIEFYAFDPATEKIQRFRQRVNYLRKRYKTLNEFRQYATVVCCKINEQLVDGWTPFKDQTHVRQMTLLVDVVPKFVADAEKNLRPATVRCYRSITKYLMDFVQERCPHIPAAQFGKVQAVDFMEWQEQRRELRSRSYNNIVKGASVLFGWLVDKMYCTENPFLSVKRKRVDVKTRTVIPEEARKQIEAYWLVHNPRYLLVCLLVYNALIRPKEICMLRVEDVFLDERYILVRSEVAKTHYERRAALSDRLIEILQAMDLASYRPTDYLVGVGYKVGPKMMLDSRLRKDWSVMRRELGLPTEYQLYSLRDSGITGLLDAGVPARTVMLAADHHDLSITTTYASHADRELIDKLNKNAIEF